VVLIFLTQNAVYNPSYNYLMHKHTHVVSEGFLQAISQISVHKCGAVCRIS